ncbi:uncharacterized protein LOC116336836 [Contarinia nasturtii]|uniref:uncharacterized protein LOC116336836 n=1 Tax=Contarinia nasturtii TaxID=265458 RepID=UPI0012D4468F|nr:uncharacterized protein LOC116336836 [Contarinia nasturtii]
MAFRVICILLAVTSIAYASVFSQCEQDPEAVSVHVDNCNDEYCEVKRSTPANMELAFRTVKEATNLSSTVRAQVAGKWFPWPLGSASKVCNNLKTGSCPVPANTEATYGFSIKIPIIAPVGSKPLIEIKITDQDKTVVACTRFPVLVVA